MNRTLQRMRSIIKHPATQLVSGLILLISGGSEIISDFLDAEHRFRLGAHHGVALVGLIQSLGCLPDFIDGLDHSFEAVDQHREQRGKLGITSTDVNETSHPATDE